MRQLAFVLVIGVGAAWPRDLPERTVDPTFLHRYPTRFKRGVATSLPRPVSLNRFSARRLSALYRPRGSSIR